MKIGIVADNDLNNDNRVIREIAILKEQKHELFILCLDFGRYNSDPVPGIVVKRITLNRKIKNLLFFFQNLIPVYEWFWALNISRFISINNLEALHVHDLYMSEPSHRGIVRSGRKIPLILDLHENYSYAVTTYNWTKGFLRSLVSRPHLWKKKEENLLLYARKIIVLSREFRDELLKCYKSLSPDNFCIFPNVPDLKQIMATKEKTKPVYPFPEKAPLLFYFGTVAERRGIFDALEVFRKLQGKAINARLMIAGPVDKKDRKRFYRVTGSNDIKSKVSYIPWINYRELPAYLEISDICLAPFLKNPQHESGVANKIFDYMLGSRPVVASDCKPQKNLIEKYKCGVIFSDLEEFEEAIITLLRDDNLRREMGRNGHMAVVRELNTEKFRHDLTEMYDQLQAEPVSGLSGF